MINSCSLVSYTCMYKTKVIQCTFFLMLVKSLSLVCPGSPSLYKPIVRHNQQHPFFLLNILPGLDDSSYDYSSDLVKNNWLILKHCWRKLLWWWLSHKWMMVIIGETENRVVFQGGKVGTNQAGRKCMFYDFSRYWVFNFF